MRFQPVGRQPEATPYHHRRRHLMGCATSCWRRARGATAPLSPPRLATGTLSFSTGTGASAALASCLCVLSSLKALIRRALRPVAAAPSAGTAMALRQVAAPGLRRARRASSILLELSCLYRSELRWKRRATVRDVGLRSAVCLSSDVALAWVYTVVLGSGGVWGLLELLVRGDQSPPGPAINIASDAAAAVRRPLDVRLLVLYTCYARGAGLCCRQAACGPPARLHRGTSCRPSTRLPSSQVLTRAHKSLASAHKPLGMGHTGSTPTTQSSFKWGRQAHVISASPNNLLYYY